MYLKTLTLRGFKSFASATTLRFEPGITCVVGPNGSGKSNVVDAFSWVMGEQGVKPLRGGKMEDVVFAGTSSRPPLGRAEVTLTIDNTDGALPIDYTEVTISRLLFRSGQSEYAINGNQCRLLDVAELLSDSGLGREMHVIVGQGQLDDVLHAGPEARRALIEEAAGVLKHRRRKEKALRKLEAMQANLTRLVDLTGELRRRLGPLGRQAALARRAAAIQADLRDARLRLLADDYVTAAADLERGQTDETAALARRGELEQALAQARPARVRARRRRAASTRRGWRRRRRHGSRSPRSPSACAESAGSRRSATPTWWPSRSRRAPAATRTSSNGKRPGCASRRRCWGSGWRPPGRSSPRRSARGRRPRRPSPRPSGNWPRRRARPPPGRSGWPGCAGRSARPAAGWPPPGRKRAAWPMPLSRRDRAPGWPCRSTRNSRRPRPAATTTAAAWPPRTSRRPRRWARSRARVAELRATERRASAERAAPRRAQGGAGGRHPCHPARRRGVGGPARGPGARAARSWARSPAC